MKKPELWFAVRPVFLEDVRLKVWGINVPMMTWWTYVWRKEKTQSTPGEPPFRYYAEKPKDVVSD